METKTVGHTPGPWEIREIAFEPAPGRPVRRVYRVEIIAPQFFNGRRTHSRDIGQILDYCEWTDHPANASLITAAPELLVALKSVVFHFGPWHDDDCPGDDTCACSAKPIHDLVNAAIAKAEGR